MSDGIERDVGVFMVDDHAVVLDGLSELLDGGARTRRGRHRHVGRPDARPHPRCGARRGHPRRQAPRRQRRRPVPGDPFALPQTYCLILTSYDDHDAVLASVMAGASGYVLKEVRGTGLVDAIRRVAAGPSLIDPASSPAYRPGPRDGPPDSDRLAGLTDRERRCST